MVKKGSIFARLAERFRHGAGVKVDEQRTETAGRDGARADGRPEVLRQPVARVEPRVGRVEPAPVPIEPRTTRKLSEREDAMVALGSHFQELSALLRGVHSRMDGQLGRVVETAAVLQQLPALSNQQIELLRGLGQQLDRQNLLGEQMSRTLAAVPQLLTVVEAALQRAQQSDERTAAAIRGFEGTMDRVQQAMTRMADNSEQQTRATQELVSQREATLQQIAQDIQQAQVQAVGELRHAADEGMQTLRASHEDQSNRLQRAVHEHARWNKVVLVGLGVLALGMAATLTMLLLK